MTSGYSSNNIQVQIELTARFEQRQEPVASYLLLFLQLLEKLQRVDTIHSILILLDDHLTGMPIITKNRFIKKSLTMKFPRLKTKK